MAFRTIKRWSSSLNQSFVNTIKDPRGSLANLKENVTANVPKYVEAQLTAGMVALLYALGGPMAVIAGGSQAAQLYGQKREQDRFNRANDQANEEAAVLDQQRQVKEQQNAATDAARAARRRQRMLSGGGQQAITPYGAIGLSGPDAGQKRELIGTTG